MKKNFFVFLTICAAMLVGGQAFAYEAKATINTNFQITTFAVDGGAAPTVIFDEWGWGWYGVTIGGQTLSTGFNFNQDSADESASLGVGDDSVAINYTHNTISVGADTPDGWNNLNSYLSVDRYFHVVGSGIVMFTTTGFVDYNMSGQWGQAYAGNGIYGGSYEGGFNKSSYASVEASEYNHSVVGDLVTTLYLEDGQYGSFSSYVSVNFTPYDGGEPEAPPAGAVPLPGAVWLLGAGLAGITGFRKARK